MSTIKAFRVLVLHRTPAHLHVLCLHAERSHQGYPCHGVAPRLQGQEQRVLRVLGGGQSSEGQLRSLAVVARTVPVAGWEAVRGAVIFR